MRARWLLAAAAFAAVKAHAAGTLAVDVGESVRFPIEANSFSNALVIDVPAGTEQLRVRLLGDVASQDLDLLLRYATPFPDTSFDGAAPEPSWLVEHAEFVSASSGSDEFVVLRKSGSNPLREGQLHVSLINYSASRADATLTVSAESADAYVPIAVRFDDASDGCDLSGWSNPEPRDPVRGNTGTTLGEQRRLALLEAARLLSAELRPAAPISIQACWADLEFSSRGGILAQAGPNFVLVNDPGAGFNFPFLDQRYIAHSGTTAAHQAGTSLCRIGGLNCSNAPADVVAQFNLNVDPSGSTNLRFDYGLTAPPRMIGSSFVTTAMHEITHGLGFLGRLDLDSASPTFGDQYPTFNRRYDDAYGRFARSTSSVPVSDNALLRLPVADRLTTLTSEGALRFNGPHAIASTMNSEILQPAPNNYIPLHAPSLLAGGSTYSHLSASTHAAGPQLMTASISTQAPRTLGLAADLLADIGWHQQASDPIAGEVMESQYFDVARSGHGFEIRRIAGLGDANPLYFVTFYSFDGTGNPEWFTSTGAIVNGVFAPARDAGTGDSLLRNLYRGQGASPATIADPDPAFDGQLRIDFVGANIHPACTDGAPGRALDGPLAVMTWVLDGDEQQWCVQSLIGDNANVASDFSSQWYTPSDGGWGMSVLSFPGDGQDGLALELYFPDASGRGRWAIAQTSRYVPGEALRMLMPTGYCRTCPSPGQLQFVDIGSLSIDLRRPSEGGSSVSFDVSYPGVQGGRFSRTNTPIVAVGTPRF